LVMLSLASISHLVSVSAQSRVPELFCLAIYVGELARDLSQMASRACARLSYGQLLRDWPL